MRSIQVFTFAFLFFLTQKCILCKNAFLSESEKVLLNNLEKMDTLVFKSESNYDTLVLASFKRDTIPCNPFETSNFNRELINIYWKNIDGKGPNSSVAGITILKETPRHFSKNICFFYDIKAEVIEHKIQSSQHARFGTTYKYNRKISNDRKQLKSLNYFIWSENFGFLLYEDEKGQVWERIFE